MRWEVKNLNFVTNRWQRKAEFKISPFSQKLVVLDKKLYCVIKELVIFPISSDKQGSNILQYLPAPEGPGKFALHGQFLCCTL